MQIAKFKKIGKSKYKVFFDNTEIVLYEDIILKYDLLLKKDVDVYLLDKIIEENRFYEAYYLALNYIEIKMRNKNEIYEYLSKKEFDNSVIDTTIEKLESLNLLNNKKYIEAFINDRVNLSSDGPFKIKKQLIDYDFSEEDVDEYLNRIDNNIWKEKLSHIIDKRKKLMKNKSYFMFINKLKNDLYNLGYDRYLIDELLSNISYESDSLKKEYEKVSRKFKGERNKIISSLLRKGYTYEEINSFVKNDV
jgi:regulatory protein